MLVVCLLAVQCYKKSKCCRNKVCTCCGTGQGQYVRTRVESGNGLEGARAGTGGGEDVVVQLAMEVFPSLARGDQAHPTANGRESRDEGGHDQDERCSVLDTDSFFNPNPSDTQG